MLSGDLGEAGFCFKHAAFELDQVQPSKLKPWLLCDRVQLQKPAQPHLSFHCHFEPKVSLAKHALQTADLTDFLTT